MGYRTDLAIENKELYDQEHGGKGEIKGASMEVIDYDKDLKVVRIEILDKRGEVALGKPKGNYITMEIKGLPDGEEELKDRASKALAKELSRLIKFHFKLKVLVVGLGNRAITPDSLGPSTLSKIKITRHWFLYFDADGDEEMACVSGLVPGVTASTGMETAELIEKAAHICKPEIILAIDSLAARNIERISTTIQINDTGISPGGGTGNLRTELSEKTLGCRVISLGVPTVIDARTLMLDALSECGISSGPARDRVEKSEKVGRDMIVTSSEIDLLIKVFSDIIANGINITLHPGIYS